MTTSGPRQGSRGATGAVGAAVVGTVIASAMIVAPVAAQPSPVDAGEPGDAPAASPPTAADLGAGGLPGGYRVASAEVLPAGVAAVSFDAGFGYRSGLLGDNHVMKRATGALGLGYGLTPWLSAAVVFDGRYDTHKGGGELTDDGWVGEPRLSVRAVRAMSPAWSVGGQLTVAAPGSDAPSIVPSALSVEARGLVSGRAAGGRLAWAVDAGARLDNGSASIDDPGALTLADQASLGVSAYDAVVGGGRLAYAVGRATLGLEAGVDLYLGSGAPDPRITVAATADVALTRAWDLTALVGTNLVSSPTISPTMTIPLVPYDPALVVGLGLVGRFGGGSGAGAGLGIAGGDGGGDVGPPTPTTATLAGVVTDEDGAPLVGAKVTIIVGGSTVELVTDAGGGYRADALPLGTAEITIVADGREPVRRTVELAGGEAPVVTTQLEAPPLPTQLRGTVRSFRGAGVAATIVVSPGDLTITAEVSGEFELDLPGGGEYTVTVSAPGYVSQTRAITVTDRNVTIYNFDLRTP
ncbi:MAG: carboxypeptidase regulatory-like domain-containing protein [Kofleriaceae bacterium]